MRNLIINDMKRNTYRLISLKYRHLENKFIFGPLLQPIWLNNNPIYIYNNPNLEKNIIGIQNKKQSIIYQWMNLLNGKIYIGSSYTGSNRLFSYWRPSVLNRNYPIYNDIRKYGIHNFSLAILENLGQSDNLKRDLVIKREQYYLDILFTTYPKDLILNLSPTAGKTKNYNHTLEFKLNSTGKKNPMYNKIKSKEFIYMQRKNKSGINNPMYGKKLSQDAINKISKFIYVYEIDENIKKVFVGAYSTVECFKKFHMSYDTLKKYLYSKQIYKGRIFSYIKLD